MAAAAAHCEKSAAVGADAPPFAAGSAAFPAGAAVADASILTELILEAGSLATVLGALATFVGPAPDMYRGPRARESVFVTRRRELTCSETRRFSRCDLRRQRASEEGTLDESGREDGANVRKNASI
jgi:hypothetical protein